MSWRDVVLGVVKALTRGTPPAPHRPGGFSPDFNPGTVITQGPGSVPGEVTYAPQADGEPDPGEVVWAWVPYEEDASQGKDRPVLLLAEREGTWLSLMLSSQDHDRDAADEARYGRYWMDVGTGGWDREGRPSEVRLDRLIPVPADQIRREGAALRQEIFDQVVAAARRLHEL